MSKSFCVLIFLLFFVETNHASACDPEEIILLNCINSYCTEEASIFGLYYVKDEGCTGDYKVMSTRTIPTKESVKLEKLLNESEIKIQGKGFYRLHRSTQLLIEKVDTGQKKDLKEFAEHYKKNLNTNLDHKLKVFWIKIRNWIYFVL